MEEQKKYASVKFKWEKQDRTYDYAIPDGLTIVAGDKAIVQTKRGETTVEIVGIKDASDKATASILRIAPVDEPEPGEHQEVLNAILDHNSGEEE